MNARPNPPPDTSAAAEAEAGDSASLPALARVRLMLARLEERICQDEEGRAARRGWQITRTGFAKRCYRDPRFGATPQCLDQEEVTR